MVRRSPRNRLERDTQRRDELWPDAPELVWEVSPGFAQIPRIVPMLAGLANALSDGSRPGGLYVVLWSHNWGSGLIDITDGTNLMFEADPTVKQARIARRLREELEALVKLGLIRVASKGAIQRGWVLLLDPIRAAHALTATMPTEFSQWHDILRERCLESGLTQISQTTK